MSPVTKIALVSDSVLPFHNGGKEMRIEQLAGGLAASGCDVHIYTMHWWDGPKTKKIGAITYHALSRHYPLYKNNKRSYTQGILFGIACLKLAREDFDIIETDHMPYFPIFFTKVACLIKRKPLFATWHEVVGLKGWRSYLGFAGGTIAYAIERFSVMLPNHIIAVSEQTATALRDMLHYKGKISLIENGIDSDRIIAAQPAAQRSDVVFAGRLIKHKNVDILIRAISVLAKKHPKIRCVIIGAGPESDNLQKLIRQQGLGRNVTMTGRIESSDDVYAIMKASRVFVSPSEREGFGITLREAYACGLYAVTVDAPDNAGKYLVSPDRGLVCKLSVAAIADAIETLLASDKTLHPTGVRRYGWAERIKELKQAYEI